MLFRSPVPAPPSGDEAVATPETTMSSTETSSAHVAAASEGPNKLRQRARKPKETEAERERRNKELLNNAGAAASASATSEAANPAAPPAVAALAAGPMPEDLMQCVRWSHREPIKARQDAANAVQFDLLLILTKPVIPLFMLIALGQVWNGLFSSLVVGHALRRWVPRMSYEAHHLL